MCGGLLHLHLIRKRETFELICVPFLIPMYAKRRGGSVRESFINNFKRKAFLLLSKSNISSFCKRGSKDTVVNIIIEKLCLVEDKSYFTFKENVTVDTVGPLLH